MEEIVEEIIERVNVLLEELAQENSITDNTTEIREMIHLMSIEKKESITPMDWEQSEEHSISISQDWSKRVDLLEGAFRGFRSKHATLLHHNKQLID